MTQPGLTQKEEIYASRVFYENAAARNTVVFNRGGSRSTKSYSLMQYLLTKFYCSTHKEILVVRKTMPSLKISSFKDFKCSS